MRKPLILGLSLLILVAAGVYIWQGSQHVALEMPRQEAVAPEAEQHADMAVAELDLSGAFTPDVLKIKPTDIVLGNREAPVVMLEYASMSCSGCAAFHTEVLSKIKADYIDAGKVAYVMRHLPWDNMALGLAGITYCVDEAQYYPMIDALFTSRSSWAKAPDPLAEIKKITRMFNLDGAATEACIRNPEYQKRATDSKTIAQEVLNIGATPTVFVNGEIVPEKIMWRPNKLRELLDSAVEQSAKSSA